MIKRAFNIFSLSLVLTLPASALTAESGFERAVAPLIQAHCAECHGPDMQKAKLRLDTLKPQFNERDSAGTWIKALDRISSGQMPPASEARPNPDELKAATEFLTQQLRAASLDNQRQQGRVLLRRLNRTEYQNTIRDLLGTAFEIGDLLPDDNVAAGFDNVSSALDLSSAHFVRYQEAADKALAAVVPAGFPSPHIKERRTGKELSAKVPGIAKVTNVRDDESMVLYSRMPGWTNTVSFPWGWQGGTYRVRLSAMAVNTHGKTMPVVFNIASDIPHDGREILSLTDVQPDKPTIITQDVELYPRERLLFNGWTLPYESGFIYTHKFPLPADFPEPGLAVQWLEWEGPITPFPGDGYKLLFGDLPLKPRSVAKAEAEHKPVPKIAENRNADEWKRDPLIPVSADPKADCEKLLRSFLPRAFRRPVDAATFQYFNKFATDRLDKGYEFGDAMLAAYKAALCSPHFLMLREDPGALDGYALAARLSYFVWRTMPDAELLTLAENGKLLQPEVLHAQLERLLNDPKAQRFVEDFTGQWLDLRKMNATSPDAQLYFEYDQYLIWSMPRETHAFFSVVLSKNLSVAQFIDSDWTFVNDRLAQHYGLKEVFGSAMQKVPVPPECHRGGVLTQSSILKVTADGSRTSPVLRGKWVLEKIIGKPPSPPPADVPSLEPDIRGATTIRQQLDKHHSTPACASCHKQIDPPGFALESYDVLGGWREFYRPSKNSSTKIELPNYPGHKISKGLPVEKGDKTPDGRAFKDIDDYKKLLLEEKEQIARNIVQKLMIFATGADIQFADREVVDEIMNKAREKDFGLRTIVHEIVGSRVFLNK